MSDVVDRIRALPPDRLAVLGQRLPPLSHAQEALWLHQQIAPSSTLYNVQYVLRAHGALDPARLAAAAREIVRRHAVLRTSIVEIDGSARQIVRDDILLDWRFMDVADQADPLAAALAEASAALLRPFALERDPLVRLGLYRLAEGDHVLALIAHHLVLDAASVRIFAGELAAVYAALERGEAAGGALPGLALQYADYALWQRGPAGEAALAGDLAWWRAQLAALPDPLDLPTDRPRGERRGEGGRVTRMLPLERRDAIDAVAREAGATRFMVLVAAWAELLGRYGNASALCIGTPVLGRVRPELAALIGNFVGNVPLLLLQRPGESLIERLAGVRETVTGAFAHQAAPLAGIAEAIGIRPGDMFRALVNMVVVPAGGEGGEAAAGDLRLAAIDTIERPGAMTDIALVIHDMPGGIRLHLDYDAALFDRETAARMIDHLDRLIGALLADPHAPVSAAVMLGQDERMMLERFGRGERIPVPADPVHVRIAAQAARTPDATAVIDGARTLSYAELEGRANALAARLAARGVGVEHHVFTLLDETAEVVVAWLAILKAGAAFVPLDRAAPVPRNRALLDQHPQGLVLGAADAIAPLALPPERWIDVNGVPEAAARFDGPQVRPDNPIYAMFTSGSTGLPKGVVVTHGGIMNRLAWMDHHFPPDCAQRVLKTTRHLFDSAIWQIFWPLTAGGATVIVDATFPEGIAPILALIRRERITAVDFVPSAFSAMIEAIEADDAAGAPLPSLRLAVFGGEQVTRDGVDWFHRTSDALVYNLYGPTEASIGCIYRPLARDYGGFIPIGLPIANSDVLLLGANGQPVPVGIAGEICLVGACLARGYLAQPGATAAAFTPAPDGARLYRTGDLGRWAAQGALEFLGRRDHQVKIRGFRIEPGEIEAALGAHPDLSRAIVLAEEQDGRTIRLRACVVPRPGSTPDPHALRAFLRDRLPEHMVPARIVLLEALPMLPNGKLDRRALLQLPAAAPVSAEDAPRAGREETIARIIGEVIGVERIGRHDNYFELGGDSIQSIRIAARARQAGIELGAGTIFAAQTVAEMARRAGSIGAVEPDEAASGDFCLTPIQRRMVERHRRIDAICHTVLFRPDAPLVPAQIDAALAALAAHHPALRLRLARQGDGSWTQHHAPAPEGDPPACAAQDLSALDPGARDGALRNGVERLRGALDVAAGPILRAALFDLGADGQRLALVVHHIAVDALSWGILLDDLQAALAAWRRGEAPRFAPATRSYRAWAERLAATAQLPAIVEQARWWTDFDWSAAAPIAGGGAPDGPPHGQSILLSGAVTRLLAERAWTGLAAQTGEVLLGCVVHALAAVTGAPSHAVALESHGRDALPDVAVDHTVGWFTLFYPVVFDAAPGGGVEETVRAVVARLRAVPGKGLPFAVGRYLRGDPALAGIPEPSVSFNYVGRLDAGAREGGLRLATEQGGWRDEDATEAAAAGGRVLDINASIVDGQLGVHLVWRSAGTGAALAGAFGRAVRSAIEDIAARLEADAPADPPSEPAADSAGGFDLLAVK